MKYLRLYMLITIAFLAGCNEQKTAESNKAELPIVGTKVLTPAPITPYVEFIGRTKAAKDVDIVPRVGGELIAVHFKDGQFVQKGSLLYQIDNRPYKAEKMAAEARLNKAHSNLDMTKSNAERAKKLIKDKSISKQQYDKAIAENLTAFAEVAEAEAALMKARLDLEYTTLTAPFSGQVGFSNFEVGDRVTSVVKNRLVSITQLSPIRFEFDINEKLYRRIRYAISSMEKEGEVDVDISLTLSDGTVHGEKGSIYAIENKVNSETGAIRVQVSFANKDHSLLPGEFGKLRLMLANQTIDGLLIPQSAILRDQRGSYVLVVDDNHMVKARYIETAQTYGPDQAVISGLDSGEHIIVSGLQKVRPGMEVSESTTM